MVSYIGLLITAIYPKFEIMTNIRDDKFLKAFDKRVRALRTQNGMSQYELSYASDIPKSQIVRIEQGEVNTGICSASAIARALSIDPKMLFEFND